MINNIFLQKAFRTGTSTRLDDRLYAMCQIKSQPLVHLMKMIHPNLYRIDKLTDESTIHVNDRVVPQPPPQKLSAEKLTREGAFLMDCGSKGEAGSPCALSSARMLTKNSVMRFSRGRGGFFVRSVLPCLQLLTVSQAEATSPAND
ncbi:protein transport protein Sec24B-like isoform X1 [Oxyura jamaicensis]|uniref:protein transport protein Sec24B-like isoform X1 n=1 Tax=Oxyura jamaicensis TaxID=8884 RepID=UPI0015A58E25|nr:protein transport protein Sec24B-like isoform X1 [Oxyura jamaicensis]